MKSDQVPARRWHHGAQASQQILRLEHECECTVAPGLLHRVADAVAVAELEALSSDRRPAEVAAELLEPLPVAGGDGAGGVHVEAQDFGDGLAPTSAVRIEQDFVAK